MLLVLPSSLKYSQSMKGMPTQRNLKLPECTEKVLKVLCSNTRVKGAGMGIWVGFLQGSVGFLPAAFIKVNPQP